jgi:hypothetical protein
MRAKVKVVLPEPLKTKIVWMPQSAFESPKGSPKAVESPIGSPAKRSDKTSPPRLLRARA